MALECTDEEIGDLRDTVKLVQEKGPQFTSFVPDITNCTWDKVLEQLRKAQEAAGPANLDFDRKRNPYKTAARKFGVAATILSPGLAAIPDHLSVLQGGLAVVFSVSIPTGPNQDSFAAGRAETKMADMNFLDSSRDTAQRTEPGFSMPWKRSPMLSKRRGKEQNTLLWNPTT